MFSIIYIKIPQVAASSGQDRPSVQTPGHPDHFYWRGAPTLRPILYLIVFQTDFQWVIAHKLLRLFPEVSEDVWRGDQDEPAGDEAGLGLQQVLHQQPDQ